MELIMKYFMILILVLVSSVTFAHRPGNARVQKIVLNPGNQVMIRALVRTQVSCRGRTSRIRHRCRQVNTISYLEEINGNLIVEIKRYRSFAKCLKDLREIEQLSL
jgi:hypothetical protein